ncbi:MAG: MerR family transcriptional regulator [Deltaproteobacteria bacterium]|nr:MerR family transcriptional regulator [Deltaproteobacteria bacterium]
MKPQFFTTREICRKLGLKERMLIHWAEKRFVRPIQDADGFPSRRLYSPRNLLEIAVIQALWGKVSNQSIKEVLTWLKQYENFSDLPDFFVIWGDGSTSRLSYDDLTGGPQVGKAGLGVMERPMFLNRLYKNDTGTLLNVHKIRRKVRDLFDLPEIFAP